MQRANNASRNRLVFAMAPPGIPPSSMIGLGVKFYILEFIYSRSNSLDPERRHSMRRARAHGPPADKALAECDVALVDSITIFYIVVAGWTAPMSCLSMPPVDTLIDAPLVWMDCTTKSVTAPTLSGSAWKMRSVPTSTERLVETNGVRLRVIEAGERGAPVVVLAHGFPELAYSWRHQIPALAEAGYRVLAPDQRGYGGSSKPGAVDAYTIVELSADIVGLLDDVGADRAALIGHDFGGVVAWNAPLLHPDRFAGIAGVECSTGAAVEGADDAGLPQDLRRQLLLHPLLPGARSGGRRAEPRPGHHTAQADGFADNHRRGRGAADAATRPGGIHRPHSGPGRAARLDQPGRVRPLRQRHSPGPASPHR